jgi:hypothetical protein
MATALASPATPTGTALRSPATPTATAPPAAPTATATADRATGRKSPRLIAVPECEPPFDDEISATHRVRRLRDLSAAPPPSTVRASTPTPITAFTAASTAVAPLVASPAVPDLSQAGDIGVRHTSTQQLPPAQRAATAMSRALIEILTGMRPANQLSTHCTPPVFAALLDRTPLPGSGLARLQSTHVCEPTDGVAEVAAVYRRGPRARAIAFRLAGLDGRWRITALQVG